MISYRRLRLRRGTATQWSTANSVLAEGELGYDTVGKVLKIGDGTTAWTSLASAATVGKLKATNSASATTPGSVTKKIEVFDGAGTSLGFIAVYSSIT